MKTNIIKVTPINSAYAHLKIEYKNTEELAGTKFLGMYIDKNMNWTCHIDQILRKLSVACFVIRKLFHVLNSDALRTVYFTYFHSIIKYVIIFWGNFTNARKDFKLQRRLIIIMSGVNTRRSCRDLFEKVDFYLYHVNIYCL
jgi:hypothetical protein